MYIRSVYIAGDTAPRLWVITTQDTQDGKVNTSHIINTVLTLEEAERIRKETDVKVGTSIHIPTIAVERYDTYGKEGY
jgi:hypothetical protein